MFFSSSYSTTVSVNHVVLSYLFFLAFSSLYLLHILQYLPLLLFSSFIQWSYMLLLSYLFHSSFLCFPFSPLSSTSSLSLLSLLSSFFNLPHFLSPFSSFFLGIYLYILYSFHVHEFIFAYFSTGNIYCRCLIRCILNKNYIILLYIMRVYVWDDIWSG